MDGIALSNKIAGGVVGNKLFATRFFDETQALLAPANLRYLAW